jgi:hypothetical protein
MKYAIIESKKVVNIIVADPGVIGDLFPSGNYAECPDGVGIGWGYIDEEFLAPVEPEPIPVPNWPGFNFYLFSNPEFITYGLAIQSANPYLVPAVIERYGQVAKVGLQESDFASYWNYFCQLGQVLEINRGIWADTAEAFDLPAEFVAVVRGA